MNQVIYVKSKPGPAGIIGIAFAGLIVQYCWHSVFIGIMLYLASPN